MHHLHIIAGEASGDSHGAALLEELQRREPGVRFTGLGGPKIRAIAPEVRDWVDDAAVVGLWEVLKRYPFFKAEFEKQLAEIASARPDAVVFVDYPGFNLRLAAALRERVGYRGKLIYFISPQVWAWNRSRIPKMGRLLDLMLCIFPFEKELYEASGLKTEFIGHPMLDKLGAIPKESRDASLVGLFPGSREREIRKILPPMLGAANRLLAGRAGEGLRFEVACATPRLEPLVRQFVEESGVPAGRIAVSVGQAYSLMQRAGVGAVASGTATLEATYFGLPYVLVYRVNWLTYRVARAVVAVDFLGMANILAGRKIVEELIQDDATPERIGAQMERLLTDHAAREKLQVDLQHVINGLGVGGAASNAAGLILSALS